MFGTVHAAAMSRSSRTGFVSDIMYKLLEKERCKSRLFVYINSSAIVQNCKDNFLQTIKTLKQILATNLNAPPSASLSFFLT